MAAPPGACRSRHRVTQAVEGLGGGSGRPPAEQPLGVFLLDVRRVGQHDRAEITGGGGGVDRAVKAAPRQQREPADVVHMRVTQDNGIDPAGIDALFHVPRVCRRPPPLEQPGVEENPRGGSARA